MATGLDVRKWLTERTSPVAVPICDDGVAQLCQFYGLDFATVLQPFSVASREISLRPVKDETSPFYSVKGFQFRLLTLDTLATPSPAARERYIEAVASVEARAEGSAPPSVRATYMRHLLARAVSSACPSRYDFSDLHNSSASLLYDTPAPQGAYGSSANRSIADAHLPPTATHLTESAALTQAVDPSLMLTCGDPRAAASPWWSSIVRDWAHLARNPADGSHTIDHPRFLILGVSVGPTPSDTARAARQLEEEFLAHPVTVSPFMDPSTPRAVLLFAREGDAGSAIDASVEAIRKEMVCDVYTVPYCAPLAASAATGRSAAFGGQWPAPRSVERFLRAFTKAHGGASGDGREVAAESVVVPTHVVDGGGGGGGAAAAGGSAPTGGGSGAHIPSLAPASFAGAVDNAMQQVLRSAAATLNQRVKPAHERVNAAITAKSRVRKVMSWFASKKEEAPQRVALLDIRRVADDMLVLRDYAGAQSWLRTLKSEASAGTPPLVQGASVPGVVFEPSSWIAAALETAAVAATLSAPSRTSLSVWCSGASPLHQSVTPLVYGRKDVLAVLDSACTHRAKVSSDAHSLFAIGTALLYAALGALYRGPGSAIPVLFRAVVLPGVSALTAGVLYDACAAHNIMLASTPSTMPASDLRKDGVAPPPFYFRRAAQHYVLAASSFGRCGVRIGPWLSVRCLSFAMVVYSGRGWNAISDYVDSASMTALEAAAADVAAGLDGGAQKLTMTSASGEGSVGATSSACVPWRFDVETESLLPTPRCAKLDQAAVLLALAVSHARDRLLRGGGAVVAPVAYRCAIANSLAGVWDGVAAGGAAPPGAGGGAAVGAMWRYLFPVLAPTVAVPRRAMRTPVANFGGGLGAQHGARGATEAVGGGYGSNALKAFASLHQRLSAWHSASGCHAVGVPVPVVLPGSVKVLSATARRLTSCTEVATAKGTEGKTSEASPALPPAFMTDATRSALESTTVALVRYAESVLAAESVVSASAREVLSSPTTKVPPQYLSVRHVARAQLTLQNERTGGGALGWFESAGAPADGTMAGGVGGEGDVEDALVECSVEDAVVLSVSIANPLSVEVIITDVRPIVTFEAGGAARDSTVDCQVERAVVLGPFSARHVELSVRVKGVGVATLHGIEWRLVSTGRRGSDTAPTATVGGASGGARDLSGPSVPCFVPFANVSLRDAAALPSSVRIPPTTAPLRPFVRPVIAVRPPPSAAEAGGGGGGGKGASDSVGGVGSTTALYAPPTSEVTPWVEGSLGRPLAAGSLLRLERRVAFTADVPAPRLCVTIDEPLPQELSVGAVVERKLIVSNVGARAATRGCVLISAPHCVALGAVEGHSGGTAAGVGKGDGESSPLPAGLSAQHIRSLYRVEVGDVPAGGSVRVRVAVRAAHEGVVRVVCVATWTSAEESSSSPANVKTGTSPAGARTPLSFAYSSSFIQVVGVPCVGVAAQHIPPAAAAARAGEAGFLRLHFRRADAVQYDETRPPACEVVGLEGVSAMRGYGMRYVHSSSIGGGSSLSAANSAMEGIHVGRRGFSSVVALTPHQRTSPSGAGLAALATAVRTVKTGKSAAQTTLMERLSDALHAGGLPSSRAVATALATAAEGHAETNANGALVAVPPAAAAQRFDASDSAFGDVVCVMQDNVLLEARAGALPQAPASTAEHWTSNIVASMGLGKGGGEGVPSGVGGRWPYSAFICATPVVGGGTHWGGVETHAQTHAGSGGGSGGAGVASGSISVPSAVAVLHSGGGTGGNAASSQTSANFTVAALCVAESAGVASRPVNANGPPDLSVVVNALEMARGSGRGRDPQGDVADDRKGEVAGAARLDGSVTARGGGGGAASAWRTTPAVLFVPPQRLFMLVCGAYAIGVAEVPAAAGPQLTFQSVHHPPPLYPMSSVASQPSSAHQFGVRGAGDGRGGAAAVGSRVGAAGASGGVGGGGPGGGGVHGSSLPATAVPPVVLSLTTQVGGGPVTTPQAAQLRRQVIPWDQLGVQIAPAATVVPPPIPTGTVVVTAQNTTPTAINAEVSLASGGRARGTQLIGPEPQGVASGGGGGPRREDSAVGGVQSRTSGGNPARGGVGVGGSAVLHAVAGGVVAACPSQHRVSGVGGYESVSVGVRVGTTVGVEIDPGALVGVSEASPLGVGWR